MQQKKSKALVVDDEKNILHTIGICLESIGIDVTLCSKPQEVLQLLQQNRFDVAFVDLKMSPMDGIEVLLEIKQYSPDTTVIIMTAHGSIDTAVIAIKKGAYDYLQKPFDFEELKLFSRKVFEHHQLVHEMAELRDDLAARVAESSISILIEGESGTGKELVAHYVHRKSDRAERPFVKVNCAAIPEQLLESELFGHVRGAFTGALKDRQGRFEIADSGTIFLDEIGELSSSIQSKLLRVLQTKDFERVGENVTRKVDVRVISATNRNLDEALKEGSFREDLFYRLNGVRIKLPPLRERPEDVPFLIHHFLKKFSKEKNIEIAPDADKALKVYRWSGNVRELENVIERAALLSANGVIEMSHLPEEIRTSSEPKAFSLEEAEKVQIKKVLQIAKDYDEAAHILGVDRKTLLNKRKKFGL
jgi:DNA-binding NtrC family response regulator